MFVYVLVKKKKVNQVAPTSFWINLFFVEAIYTDGVRPNNLMCEVATTTQHNLALGSIYTAKYF